MATTLSPSDQLSQNYAYTTLIFVGIFLIALVILYNRVDAGTLLGLLFISSFAYYVWYRTWRYVPV